MGLPPGMRRLRRPLVFLGIFAVDRLSKYWAMEWLMPQERVPVLPFFHLTYVENTGAAFGLGFNQNRFFICVSAVLLGVLFYLQRAWHQKNAWIRSGLVLVSAGALGNLYDRIAYGYVVDFLDFRVWPVFNAADSCITVGACVLAWGLRLEDKKGANRAAC